MGTYIALLRGINIGGHNKISMSGLKALCEGIGFKNVRTFIQSGNVIFESGLTEEALIMRLEDALHSMNEKHIAVMVRTAKELESAIEGNPFGDADPSKVAILFFKAPLPEDALNGVTIAGPEEVKISGREIYIHYPDGMGRSKLKLPAFAQKGTGRNARTVDKLVEMSRGK